MNVYTVQIAEGGLGRVYAGDPAWNICRQLDQQGYKPLVLPLMTLMGGRPAMLLTGLTDHEGTADRELRIARGTLPAVEVSDEECRHHWILDEPQPGKNGVDGVCKLCNKERFFPNKNYDFVQQQHGSGQLLSAAEKRKMREIHEDWLARMASAHELIRGRHAA